MNVRVTNNLAWVLILSLIDEVLCLRCWHCIAENCDVDPADNYRASERPCQPGQACQKVYYEMYSEEDLKGYQSTVRGCSTSCQPRNDFLNCTSDLKRTRGCFRKDCCHDSDLCNHGDTVLISPFPVALLCLVSKFVCAYFSV